MARKQFMAEQIIMMLREAEVGLAQEEPYNPGRDVSINPNENSILTP